MVDEVYDNAWVKKLQIFVNDLLKKIIDNAAERAEYVNDENMKLWCKAFTHETYSRNNNYEEYEFLGDAMLKAAFPQFLVKKFPSLSKQEYNNIYHEYMSAGLQGEMSKTLGIHNYILLRGLPQSNFKLAGDCFESFFGALCVVSDSFRFGLGYLNCYNMVVALYKDQQFDEDIKLGAVKTQVEQIFGRFPNIGKPENFSHRTEKGGVFFKVLLTADQINFLKSYGKNVPEIIGYAERPTQSVAETIAYKNALATLKNFGVTKFWAEAEKLKLTLSDPALIAHVTKAREKALKQGYEDIDFYDAHKLTGPEAAVIELLGIKGKTKNILGVAYVKDRKLNLTAAKIKLLQDFNDDS